MDNTKKVVTAAILKSEWDDAYESQLRQTATGGVIKFFNAVYKAKKDIKNKSKDKSTYLKEKREKQKSQKKFLKKVMGKPENESLAEEHRTIDL